MGRVKALDEFDVSFSGGEKAKSAGKMVNLTVTDDNSRSD